MAITSEGYIPPDDKKDERDNDFQVFTAAIDQVLDKEESILSCPDYFFTPLSFASCSWPYVGGSGPLCLGYLMLGWKVGLLIEDCPKCREKALVTSFGGSPLSGSNSWTGFCTKCRVKVSGKDSIHKPFAKRLEFILSLRKTYPEKILNEETYTGSIFSWGGDGFTEVTKKRLVEDRLWNSVTLEALLDELAVGANREKLLPTPYLAEGNLELTFTTKNGETRIISLNSPVD